MVASLRLHYLQYVVKLGFELKVRFGLYDGSFQRLLQHLNPSLGLLTGVRDTHVLPFTAQSLLLGFVHLSETRGGLTGRDRRQSLALFERHETVPNEELNISALKNQTTRSHHSLKIKCTPNNILSERKLKITLGKVGFQT